MLEWAKKGEIPLDPKQIKIPGANLKGLEKTEKVVESRMDTNTTRFLKRLMAEENLHLSKLSSKNSDHFKGGLTLAQLQKQVKGADANTINLLGLKINKNYRDDLNA